jgi:DNA-directed RNA polymerase subunit beta'
MAYYNPVEPFEALKKNVSDTVQNQFPVQGKKNTLRATKVWVEDDKAITDIHSQEDAKLKEKTWSVPVKAQLELVDNVTGKVKDSKAVTLGQLPKITNRWTYIVDGQERQVVNQFRLRSGVYTHLKENGELTSQWNLVKGLGFNMTVDPKSKRIGMTFAGKAANISVYPVLKLLGIDDDMIERSWGKEILDANKSVAEDGAINKVYMALKGSSPPSREETRKQVLQEFGKMILRPDSTKITLGKPFDTVDGKALLAGSSKLLKVSRQEEPPDDRDSLLFKDLYSVEDLLPERLQKKNSKDIRRKVFNNVDKKSSISEIIHPDIFGKPIKEFFNQSSLSELPDEMNPMSYISGNRRTTILKEHGVSDPQKLTMGARAINSSHLGFLDPIQTPESEALGASLQLSLAARKHGNTLQIRMWNIKDHKYEYLDPSQALKTSFAFPDQVKKTPKGLIPIGKMIKGSDSNGNITMLNPASVTHVLASSRSLFDFAANLIPFLQTNQGNRAMTAAKQMEQAFSLKDREEPLIQVHTSEEGRTFEQTLGEIIAHVSPVDGTVTKVTDKSIFIKDKAGKPHEVMLYKNFPLNDSKSVITSEPLVKVGDKVSKKQPIADTNFSKNGTMALGTNLRVAYMPWRGYNYDDGIVISETAAKKLTSVHMFREQVTQESNTILDKKKLVAQVGSTIMKDSIDKLDDRGIIQVGQTVKPGDILIGALKHEEITPEQKQLGLFSKKLIKPVKPNLVTWDREVSGKVVRVVQHGKNTTVYVRADEPADVGDKLVGRYGNKGVITTIIPDHEMPKDTEDRPMEILLNPSGVPSRINMGQILETAASKIARKTGKTYVVNNFDPSIPDYTRHLYDELKKHGLSDTEELVDPSTGRKFPKVLAGEQYILKLHHTAEKGMSARSRGAYDANMTPKGGGPAGGQSMDAMGLYALLAHNARANIQEMQSSKSERNDDYWAALQAGDSLPAPKVPFVFKKFEGYLKLMGLDTVKEGNDLVLQPLTDAKTKRMSAGEIKDPGRCFQGSTMKPEKGGIFDPKITGTQGADSSLVLGSNWSHITLAERMPNPVFEKPIRELLGLSDSEFTDVIKGDGKIGGKTGPAAVVHALEEIKVNERLAGLEKQVKTLRGAKLDKANKSIKYLRALKKSGLSVQEAYTVQYLPVLPPIMRPVSVADDGRLNINDMNKLYNMIGATNQQLKSFDPKVHPEEEFAAPLRNELYDGLKSITITGTKTAKGKPLKGATQIFSGPGPKEGFFQERMIGKRQDLSMRATIIPEPSMSLDEVGVPRKAAQELYKPFIIANLIRSGLTAPQATKEIKNNSEMALKALETVMGERPLILKRDPVLHKHGVQAFRPRIVGGRALRIHPLSTSGYNADFDGDHMAAFVPASTKAVEEARKMIPSHNLFSPSTGFVMYKPTQESLLGLYKLTEMNHDSTKIFADIAHAAKAVNDGKLSFTSPISLHKIDQDITNLVKMGSPVRTTIGRLLVYNALPEELRDPKILTDPAFKLDSKSLNDLLGSVAVHRPQDYGKVTDRLKNLGNEFSTGTSVGLEDFMSRKNDRDKILQDLGVDKGYLPHKHTEEETISMHEKVDERSNDTARTAIDKSKNRMYDWVRAGAKGNWDQFKQMVVAPTVVSDVMGNKIPVSVNKSYSEGLDIGSYWASMHGARMGTLSRVEGTWRPGLLSKQMMRSTMNQMIVSEDCGTDKGISMPIEDRNIVNRYTSQEIVLGQKTKKDKGTIPAGTVVTPDVLSRLRNNKITDIRVRSPLKCAHGDGICAKCYGINEEGKLHQKGVNVGVRAAHALGEPLTQLSMNSFHTGGITGSAGSKAVSLFDRIDQLTQIPRVLPGAATLAREEGKVEKIENDAAGGYRVTINGASHYVPGSRKLIVKKGDTIKKGDQVSTGVKNPREILHLQGIGAVQNYLTSEMEKNYSKTNSPLFRRNVETVVRVMTNLSEVTDPGSSDTYLKGDMVPTSLLNEYNSKATKDGKEPVKAFPILRSISSLPLDLQEDWIARLQSTHLKDTVLDAAAEGWRSALHGTHPIPAMAYAAEFGQGTKEKPWLY